MKKINPLEIFFWTFRRNEKDVIKLYDSLSDVMRIATGGDMLNFGFWDEKTASPIEAQKNLCEIFSKMAQLTSKQNVVDIGSGFGSPALQWCLNYDPIKITCVNINFRQLSDSIKEMSRANDGDHKIKNNKSLNFINTTATMLPFEDASVDRVLALDSVQHFKPLKNFLSESKRILKENGILALAIPVMIEKPLVPIAKLGILSMTWSSEHYTIDFVTSLIKQEGFHISELRKVGSNVYEPLADYYLKNRASLKTRILREYPDYVEKILKKSLVKLKQVSQSEIIDYLLIVCKK
ncbi:MAG: class I SAM-dependent methyltransferase [Nitrosopumilaceae archaeon]